MRHCTISQLVLQRLVQVEAHDNEGEYQHIVLDAPTYESLVAAVVSAFPVCSTRTAHCNTRLFTQGRQVANVEYILKIPDTYVADDEDVSLLESGQELRVYWQ